MRGGGSGGTGFDRLERELRGQLSIWASGLLLLICAIVVAGLLWAFVAQVEHVTRASGRVVPVGQMQMVHAPLDGVIASVEMAVGTRIEAGAPLLRLDDVVHKSRFQSEAQRSLALRLRLARLEGEISGQAPQFDPDLAAQDAAVVAAEAALYQGRVGELAGELAVLRSSLAQREAEIAAHNVTAASLRADLEFLQEEQAFYQPLLASGLTPKTTDMRLRREAQMLRGQISRGLVEHEVAQAAARAIQKEIESREIAFRTRALEERARVVAEMQALEKTLPALAALSAQNIIRAPIGGVVNRVLRATPGGAVRAGEIVAEIVPLGQSPEVKAFVLPQDIAFLHLGQKVRLRISAYDFTRYGVLGGEVIAIGADAVRLSERDPVDMFEVRVKLDGALRDMDGAALEILPGMTAEVDFLGAKRRVIDYVLAPITRLREKAFRE